MTGVNTILYGDIDNNNSEDLIVGVLTEGGGTGGNDLHSIDLFVFLNNNGKYQFVSVTPDNEVCGGIMNRGDNFMPYKIQGGFLIGKTVSYQDDDAMCCPSLEYNTKVKFNGNKLVFNSKCKAKKITYKDQQ